ncbi:MAG: hypothetical protein L6R42_006935, partial [Xanthoria sp. 1 TBL-2021]
IALQFDELGTYLNKHSQSKGTRRQPRALLDFSRGWGSALQAEIPATEPSEKTDRFFFIWGDAEKERSWKDGSTTEALFQTWDENFLERQREWEGMGMRSESLHVRLEDFDEQLRWQGLEAERGKPGRKEGVDRGVETTARAVFAGIWGDLMEMLDEY